MITRAGGANEIDATQVAYIHGRIEAQIEAFANSLGVPTGQLAYRVAALLLSKTSGEVLGAKDRVPGLPRKASRRKAVAKVAMAERTHSKPHLSKARRKKLSANMKRMWATKWASKRKAA